jgi:hypothetical protein
MATTIATIYCIDTSALIWAMKRTYPMDIAPAFWAKFSEAVKNGQIISTEAVLDEISKTDDDLYAWAKSQDGLFISISDDVAAQMPVVMKSCPNLIDPKRKRDEADPYVIAQAVVSRAVVVTQENPHGVNNAQINIPDACKILDLKSVNLLGMIRALGWKFN